MKDPKSWEGTLKLLGCGHGSLSGASYIFNYVLGFNETLSYRDPLLDVVESHQ